LKKKGKARATQYRTHPASNIIFPIDEENYLSLPPDERKCKNRFNLEIFDLLELIHLFSPEELKYLNKLKKDFNKNAKALGAVLLKKEYERITIEFSWKSSAIEGNTYDLLETETLIKEGIHAEGKKEEETLMILNHKYALDYVREHPEDFRNIKVNTIENLHRILTKGLSISKNIRKKLVAITGTTFKPLDNEFQIKEALEKACSLINKSQDEFSKAFLAILLISYIQPFEDGNKRTSRLLANALLMSHQSFPLSFRSVRIQDYKKAKLLFYEINYIIAFKKVFLNQYEFAAQNYFRTHLES